MKHLKWLHLFPLLSPALILTGIAAEPFVKNADERQRIEQAAPAKAIVTPLKPRKLLIFTLNMGYGGHPSIAHANEAFALMGRKTGAFETTVSADPAVFEQGSLRSFDAVFFNNTVGNCFTNAQWRQNLIEFVIEGGGLLGVHGTSVAFTRWPGAAEDWPEFGYLIGARGANHAESDERAWLKLDDPNHPVTRVFGGQGFEYRDEFFRPQGTYSRDRVRVLLSFDTAKMDPNKGQIRGNGYRADNDYAMAWVRSYGRGRVFYSTIAHNPAVFWDPKMLEFYLAALQFALGDLPAPTTPSARLTPAVKAQEKLGWRLGIEARSFKNLTLFETIDRAAKLGLPYLGGTDVQTVSAEIKRPFGPSLNDTELSEVRLKLESAGARLVTFELNEIPEDEAGARQLFEFGRKMGIETFVGTPQPARLAMLDSLCEAYHIQLALSGGSGPSVRRPLAPKALVRLCRGRSKWIGICGDLQTWTRLKLNPAKAVQQAGQRLLTMQWLEPDDARLGAQVVAEIHRLGLKPTLFGLVTPSEAAEPMASLARSFDSLNAASLTEASTP